MDILGLRFDAFAAAAELPPRSRTALRALYRAAFREGRFEPGTQFGARNAARLRSRFGFGLAAVEELREEPGPWGDSAKAVLACADGRRIESVRIPSPSRAGALCVSSQVGCGMGCAFCETGRAGLARNLSAAEIVSQVVTARNVLRWEFSNVVFMGMGEPLDNFDGLAGALGVMLDPDGLAFSQERITVCTAGLPQGIRRLRGLGLRRLNLSVSLNAADDAARRRLMPVNGTAGLAELAAALADYPDRRSFVLGVNWCLLPGINDSLADARGAASFCASVGRTLLNLIPYNPGTAPIARAPTELEIQRFAGLLEAEGLAVRRRATRGRSIMAGCGQLGASP
jgi:23S rRNA (adenine2503-C2)-methyltransferase